MCYHILTSAGIPTGYVGTCGVIYGDVHIATNNTTPGPMELQHHLSNMRHAGVKTVLLEVSSQAIWQHRIRGISFDAVALTNLFSDHIGQGEHPDFDHYAACKKQLLTDFGAPFVLANADDANVSELTKNIPAVRCGLHAPAAIQAIEVCSQQMSGLPGMTFAYYDGTQSIPVFLPLPGEHNVSNALFALTLTAHLGIDVATAALSLKDIRIPGRLETISIGEAMVVIDYAHNGGALRAALTSLRPYATHRLFCLVGSVGERTQCRRSEIGQAAGELADFTYLTADDPGSESVEDICREIAAAMPSCADYTIIPDRKDAILKALDHLQSGDVLLLAGKGDEQFQKIGGKLLPHNDRAVVEEYLNPSTVLS
jgi:UDP-N-acetylmuramoyl-L-alanyl-D-glutamate--2,6-diaminopimelate ligase